MVEPFQLRIGFLQHNHISFWLGLWTPVTWMKFHGVNSTIRITTVSADIMTYIVIWAGFFSCLCFCIFSHLPLDENRI